MQKIQEKVCIVTGNAEFGATLRDLIRAAKPCTCVVVSSLACLQRVADDGSTMVVFLDREVDVNDFEKNKRALREHTVVTFGTSDNQSEVLKSRDSEDWFQLRHPLDDYDVQHVFNCLDGRGKRDSTSADQALRLHRGLVGDSEVVQELKSIIERVSPSMANVIILGETGTGKEIVARNIHYRSANNGGSFVPVNCSAIPAELLESELFGHRKGSFTGALSDRVGRFELAAGGTLFLDEIGDMPMALQVKLLRVLEERIIYPVGSDAGVPMTARLVAATHRNLKEQVEKGLFREDLYYRLHVVPVTVPALRERKDDIPHLVRELGCRIRHAYDIEVEFLDEALQCLQNHDWPGNVRELANLVERLTVMHPGGRIGVKELPSEFRGAALPASPISNPITLSALDQAGGFNLKEYLLLTEATIIEQALQASGGVVTKAAKVLHLNRTTLTEKVKRLGLDDMIRQAM